MAYFAPKFNGDNPQKWLLKILLYFNSYKIPEDQRLDIIVHNLEGGALQWYQWMRTQNLSFNWHQLLEKIGICFEPSEFKHYQLELSTLKQKGSVAEFRAQFERVVNNIVIGVSESLLISSFIEGLEDHLRGEVQLAKPRTLLEAFAVASYFEEVSQGMTRWIDRSDKGFEFDKASNGPIFGSAPKRRRLNTADLIEKRSKGLCYNCDKKFNPKLPCPCRQKSAAV